MQGTLSDLLYHIFAGCGASAISFAVCRSLCTSALVIAYRSEYAAGKRFCMGRNLRNLNTTTVCLEWLFCVNEA